jgi:hypothetical protein
MAGQKDLEPKYGPLEPEVSSGATQVVGVVRGRERKLPGGDTVSSEVRVVNGPNGTFTVDGGMGASITVYEADKITTEPVSCSIQNALNRGRENRKRKKERIKASIKKSARG